MTTDLHFLNLARPSLKRKLLVYFFTHPEASLYVREIAVLLNLDPANLSRELRRLEKEGVFGSRKQGNLKYFSLNKSYLLHQEINSIISKTINRSAKRHQTKHK